MNSLKLTALLCLICLQVCVYAQKYQAYASADAPADDYTYIADLEEKKRIIAQQAEVIESQKAEIARLQRVEDSYTEEKERWVMEKERWSQSFDNLSFERNSREAELVHLYSAYDSAVTLIHNQEKIIQDFQKAKQVADEIIRRQKAQIAKSEKELVAIKEELKTREGKRIYYRPWGVDSHNRKKKMAKVDLDLKGEHYLQDIDTLYIEFDDLLLQGSDGVSLLARYQIRDAYNGNIIHEGKDFIYRNGKWGEAMWQIPIKDYINPKKTDTNRYVLDVYYMERSVIANHRFQLLKK